MSMFRNLLISKKRNKLEPIWLEYLESTGTQWIDTGVGLKNIKAELTVQATQTTNNVGGIIALDAGWYVGTNPNSFKLNYLQLSIELKTHISVEYNFDENKLSINNTNISHSTKIPSINAKYSLFSINRGYYSYIKIYSCQIYNGDVLVRDFRPCLNPQTLKPGMYDMVSGQYYYNQGTGEDFKYEYTFTTLDYIESDGEQRLIYSRLSFNETFKIETTIKSNHTTNNNSQILVLDSDSPNYIVLRNYNSTTPKQLYIPNNGITLNNTEEKVSIKLYQDSDNYIHCITNNNEYITRNPMIRLSNPVIGFLYGNENYQCNIYDFKIYDGAIKILDLIPVRKLDGTIGMYDFISGEYKLNSGTGKFKGFIGDIQVGESIEYISETRYPSYFESGLKGNKYTELWVKSEWFNDNSYPIVIGASYSEPTYKTRIYLRGKNSFMGIQSTSYSRNGFNYISKDLMIVDDTSYTNPFVSIEDIPDTAETVTTIKIFNTTGTGSAAYYSSQGDKLWFAMIKDRTHLMAFIPCKKNSVIACYDPISREIIPYSRENLLALNE